MSSLTWMETTDTYYEGSLAKTKAYAATAKRLQLVVIPNPNDAQTYRLQLNIMQSQCYTRIVETTTTCATLDDVLRDAPEILRRAVYAQRTRGEWAIGNLDQVIMESDAKPEIDGSAYKRLRNAIARSYVESGMMCEADHEAEEIIEEYGMPMTFAILKKIASDSPDSSELHVILHVMESRRFSPYRPHVLEVMKLCSSNTKWNVQEEIISCAEYHEMKEAIPLLRSLNITESWINFHRIDAIQEIMIDNENHVNEEDD